MSRLTKINAFLICLILLCGVVITAKYLLFKKPEQLLNTNRASVIQEMRSLQRLETASFTIEKIIDGGTTELSVFQNFLFGDRILLIAHGQVIAGFDLSQISDQDIEIEDGSIRVTLPKPQILVTSLDNSQTRVYDRRRGILNPGDADLEADARAAAEKSITVAACTGGILDQASENGRKQVTSLLSALGFDNVIIDIPQGNCY